MQLAPTTAELLLRAAEATHILGPEVSTEDVAKFLGGATDRAEHALRAATELGFATQGSDNDHWTGTRLARIAAQLRPEPKTILLRYQLEQFPPYAAFRNRIIAGEGAAEAARQSCVQHGLSVDALDAEGTLINLGTYSGDLLRDGGQLVVVVDAGLEKMILEIQALVMEARQAVNAHIVQQLGVDAASFATGEALDYLVDSYTRVLDGQPYADAMFLLGKGLESWLKQLVTLDPPLTLPAGTNTMGAVARFLKENNRLNSKHHSILSGIIAIRNASDHSADPEIGGATWTVTRETALAVSHLTWSTMRSFFAVRNGNHAL